MRALVPVAVVLASLSVALVGAGQVAFRGGVDLTTFAVSVVDKKGNPVTGLTRDDFEVVEDGKPQHLSYFTLGDGDGELSRLHVGLMLDTSASMEQDLRLARSAAVKFLNLLPQSEDITLVDFDTQVRVTRYPQRDFARLVERIRMRKSDGWTALYDALGVYLDGAAEQTGRPVLVMYTDGADSRSSLGFNELMNLLKASHATVYAVGLVQNTGGLRMEVQARLRQMTEITGGQAFFPAQLDELDETYAKVIDEIGRQYHLGYASTNTATDGAWRKVSVKVKSAGVRVRTRKGYFGPYQPGQH